jgi:hypothetical protein
MSRGEKKQYERKRKGKILVSTVATKKKILTKMSTKMENKTTMVVDFSDQSTDPYGLYSVLLNSR